MTRVGGVTATAATHPAPRHGGPGHDSPPGVSPPLASEQCRAAPWGRDLVTTGTCPSSVSCPRSPSAARDAGGGAMTDPSPRTTTTSSPGRIYTTGSYCQGNCTILVILPIILKVHLYIYSVIFIMRQRVRACKLGIFRSFSLVFVLIP